MDTSKLNLRKSYDFLTLSNLDDFTDRYIWEREHIINKENQYYAPTTTHDPFTLNASGLTITASHTPTRLRPLVGNQPYLSGVLTSRDRGHSQLYGYWEAKCRLPSAKGCWPAFWLLPTHDQWPEGIAVLSEIDIMEAVSTVMEGIYHGSSHTNQTGELVSEGNEISTVRELTEYFHLFALSWTEKWLVWYFEGIEVLRKPTPIDMNVARHFLLNLAVGGWGGLVIPTDYPQKSKFEIEYVNIYDFSDDDDVNFKEVSDEPILLKPGSIAQKIIELHGLDGDAVWVLEDGSIVTKRNIDKITKYLMELNKSL